MSWCTVPQALHRGRGKETLVKPPAREHGEMGNWTLGETGFMTSLKKRDSVALERPVGRDIGILTITQPADRVCTFTALWARGRVGVGVPPAAPCVASSRGRTGSQRCCGPRPPPCCLPRSGPGPPGQTESRGAAGSTHAHWIPAFSMPWGCPHRPLAGHPDTSAAATEGAWEAAPPCWSPEPAASSQDRGRWPHHIFQEGSPFCDPELGGVTITVLTAQEESKAQEGRHVGHPHTLRER